MDSLDVHAFMNPTLNGSPAIWHFEHGDVIEIRDGITCNFYLGLSHVSLFTFISC